MKADAVDLAALSNAGIVTKTYDGVRLLARGAVTTAVTISVNSASKAAVAAIEKPAAKLILSALKQIGIYKKASPKGGFLWFERLSGQTDAQIYRSGRKVCAASGWAFEFRNG